MDQIWCVRVSNMFYYWKCQVWVWLKCAATNYNAGHVCDFEYECRLSDPYHLVRVSRARHYERSEGKNTPRISSKNPKKAFKKARNHLKRLKSCRFKVSENKNTAVYGLIHSPRAAAPQPSVFSGPPPLYTELRETQGRVKRALCEVSRDFDAVLPRTRHG